jgi:N-methylhydantoinase B
VTLVNPGTAAEKDIGKIDILRLNPGEVVRITAPGGAGYGDPLDRDAERVLGDVENGFVSADEASETYGVVLKGHAVDEAATRARREALRNRRSDEEFVFGPERAAYEARLPAVVQDVVVELLATYPAATRQYLRDGLYAQIEHDADLSSQPVPELRSRLAVLLDELMRPALAAELGLCQSSSTATVWISTWIAGFANPATTMSALQG